MRRVLAILLATALVGGGALAALGAGSSDKALTYKIPFDNAFGLVKGADFKVAGVAVGSIEDLEVRRSDLRALITVSATRAPGFGGLRSDAKCVINPQSLIGEYFVDCQPGTKGRVLDSGASIPIRQTESPIPPDLVLNLMRFPVRERFRIILRELGAGLAARGDDLNETIRRSIPAIGATNRVLSILAENRRTLVSLSRDSGQVLKTFGERREDIGDFVTSARGLAETTAERRAELAETFRRFPGFLAELTPTMNDLGTAARLQTPALRDLRAAAPSVNRLLTSLRPFTRALQPATTSLGVTAGSGRTAARASRDLLKRLAGLGRVSQEPANNLAILLSDLDDRSRAVEPDPDSPGGKGYTGLENPLQYIFDQVLALNLFDQRGYSLKINLSIDECSEFTDAEHAKEDLERYQRCTQNLGPSAPGVTQPDPSPADPGGGTAARSGARGDRSRTRDEDPGEAGGEDAPETQAPQSTATPAPTSTPKPGRPALPPVQQLLDQIPKLLGPLDGKGTERLKDLREGLAKGQRPPAGAPAGGDSAQDLLDFLLAP